jgi:hypothetical protein
MDNPDKGIQSENRRDDERLEVKICSQILFFGTESPAYIQNISEAGFSLFCLRKFQPGTEFDIDLNVPGHETIRCSGRVKRMTEGTFESRNGYSYGIELLSIPYEYQTFLDNVVRLHPNDGIDRKLSLAGLKWWYRGQA